MAIRIQSIGDHGDIPIGQYLLSPAERFDRQLDHADFKRKELELRSDGILLYREFGLAHGYAIARYHLRALHRAYNRTYCASCDQL